jgi:hypothetical protein
MKEKNESPYTILDVLEFLFLILSIMAMLVSFFMNSMTGMVFAGLMGIFSLLFIMIRSLGGDIF